MRDYLVQKGVKEIWYLVTADKAAEGDEAVGEKGRVVARRVKGWAEHPFWAKLDAIRGLGKEHG